MHRWNSETFGEMMSAGVHVWETRGMNPIEERNKVDKGGVTNNKNVRGQRRVAL